MIAGAPAAQMAASTEREMVREAQAFSQEAWAHIYDRDYPKTSCVWRYAVSPSGERPSASRTAGTRCVFTSFLSIRTMSSSSARLFT